MISYGPANMKPKGSEMAPEEGIPEVPVEVLASSQTVADYLEIQAKTHYIEAEKFEAAARVLRGLMDGEQP